MANPWFRVWSEMINDPKWRTIARISQQRIGDVVAVYVHMMTCASNATERGRTEGWCDEDVATALDMSTEQVTSIREAMQGRVLDGDHLTGWEKRQPIREDGSAERGKAHRELEKLRIEVEQLRLERQQTQANAGERNQTGNTLDKIRRDTDKDNQDQQHSANAPPPEPAVLMMPATSGKEFGILQSHIDGWAEAYPNVNVMQQLAAMRQWCIANPKKRKTTGGMLNFCNTWLSKEQNSGRGVIVPVRANGMGAKNGGSSIGGNFGSGVGPNGEF